MSTNSSKKVIMHVLCSNRYSGAENVVCQIINMFRTNPDYEMVYCSPDGEICDALEERGVCFFPIQRVSVPELKKAIASINPTIIHAHDMRAGFMAALACGRIPLISHVHNNNFDSRKPTLKAVLYSYSAHKAKHIFWVSQSSFDGYCFHKGLEEKSTVLYNVIDSKQLVEKAQMAEHQECYDIVYLGRLTPQKKPQRLVGVLWQIIQKNDGIRAAIIGTGELEEETKALIAQNSLEHNVHMLGFISNAYGILRNAKLMIMTSRWEGTPMCALEAIALGVPIVSTPTDGLKELVEDGMTGYLSDEDENLAEACLNVCGNAVLRKKISDNTLASAKGKLNVDTYRKKLQVVYENVIDAKVTQ